MAAAGPTTPSALEAALDVVGDRWTLLVVDALLEGTLRFAELQKRLQPIAPNVLSSRLQLLEREGLAVARPYSERPLRYAYELTPAGRDLAGAVSVISVWGARHRRPEETLRHAACGTALETRLFCPTCQTELGFEEAGDVHEI
jgi:DNA-binding HxlR family transcriptional regulator